MRLVAIGINRCTGITQGLNQCNIVINIPLDRVVVIINQNSIRPALIGHLKGLDQPVVASLTATTECLLHHRITLLVHTNSFVDYINHGQRLVLGFRMIEPIGHSRKALSCRQVFQPAWILGTPYQSVKLVGKVVLLSIVESIIGSIPVEVASASFYRRPLRLILTGYLIPECIILWNATTWLYLSSGSDVTQKLVRVR